MAKHFTITVRVIYDNETIPDNMCEQLQKHFEEYDLSNLLDDDNKQAVIDDISVDVKVVGVLPSIPSEPLRQ